MTFNGKLHEYQKAASMLIINRRCCLLSLDLGCGKTIVSLHAIEKLREEGKVKCALLIMSSSLTKQWENRIKEFTDSSVIVVDGSSSPKKRSAFLETALQNPPDYLVMGIRQVVSDTTFIQKLNPDLVLVDECTSIRNFGSQQSKSIKKLKSTYRIGLTAEPIENGKAEELFSIMQWIDPDLFGDWQSFERSYINRNHFNIIQNYKNMPELHRILMTACIAKRRTDPDVAEFMPTVEEFNVFVEMDDETELVYRGVARELLQALYSAGPRAVVDIARAYGEQSIGRDDGSAVGAITSRLLACQLLLDHPSLLERSGRAYDDPNNPMGSRYASELLAAGRVPSTDVVGAKMEACIQLCEEYLEADPEHKVIVFARFKGVLPLLARHLDKYGSVVFAGDLNGKQRGEAIERFTNDPDTRLFLSSDAGGSGVDLWCGSHLINYDLPNSSGTFRQRNGRHVRASSKFRNVYINNLVMQGTIEEYQLTRLNYKAKVSSAVLTGVSEADGRVTNDGTSLTKFLQDYLGA